MTSHFTLSQAEAWAAEHIVAGRSCHIEIESNYIIVIVDGVRYLGPGQK